MQFTNAQDAIREAPMAKVNENEFRLFLNTGKNDQNRTKGGKSSPAQGARCGLIPSIVCISCVMKVRSDAFVSFEKKGETNTTGTTGTRRRQGGI